MAQDVSHGTHFARGLLVNFAVWNWINDRQTALGSRIPEEVVLAIVTLQGALKSAVFGGILTRLIDWEEFLSFSTEETGLKVQGKETICHIEGEASVVDQALSRRV